MVLFSSSALSRLYETLFSVGIFPDFTTYANIATGCECQSKTWSSYKEILRMKRSVNEAPSKMSTRRFSATLDRMQVQKSSRQRYRRANSRCTRVSFVALQGAEKLPRLMRWTHYLGIIAERIRFATAPLWSDSFQGAWWWCLFRQRNKACMSTWPNELYWWFILENHATFIAIQGLYVDAQNENSSLAGRLGRGEICVGVILPLYEWLILKGLAQLYYMYSVEPVL